MSKKILVFVALFSLALSMTITQEASALTKATGDYSRTTASLDPSKVCGIHVCKPGESSKWFHAVRISQREGPTKATGGYQGQIIMHQLVVNSIAKNSHVNSVTVPSNMNATMAINNVNTNSTGSK
jgi:hypothetical protein